MIRITDLHMPLDSAEPALRTAIAARLRVAPAALRDYTIYRQGPDARNRRAIRLTYTIDATVADEPATLAALADDPRIAPTPPPAPVRLSRARPAAPRPLVIGAGPCGLFAALTLAEAGYRPIILERGRAVRARTRDTWGLWRRGVLEPESNVQFGEGGAGTFSDGKLYSGVRDPAQLGRYVLETFVEAGAPAAILTAAKPHIGTFRLVTVVEYLRARIEALGGEYRFGTRVAGLHTDAGRLVGVHLADGTTIDTHHVILAPGHSARDLFAALHEAGVAMEAKPFSIGARIEHPQSLIDRARYGEAAGHPRLGAADYKLVHHASNGRAVYSFCMCPGGTVVAAASEPGHVVTNGMSQYSRAERNANAGIVVGITPADYPGDVLAGIALQRRFEAAAFAAGGATYAAPAQRVEDFLAGRDSRSLGDVQPSYKPGTTPANLAACLPEFAIAAMREALPHFARRIAGFTLPDAVLTGVETRTSAPVRVPRDDTFQSRNTRGLYPAGEGCGYAGGILSAAIDGIRAAQALAAALA